MDPLETVRALAVAAFFFLVALTGRSIAAVGFIERPLTIGFFWWAITGEYAPALPLAVFFELFWLDLIPIGSYIPPMASFPYLVLLFLSRQYQWTEPSVLAFPLAALLPLAYLEPYAESWQRDYQKNASNQLIKQSRSRRPLGAVPFRLLLNSMAQQYAIGLLLFTAASLSLSYFISLWITDKTIGAIPLEISWPALYAIAAIGALLSLRIKRAYIVFALCMAVLLLGKLI